MNKSEYRRYLLSLHWRFRRKQRIALARGQCEFQEEDYGNPKHTTYGPRCTNKTNLEVHHLNYDNLGAERNEDLEVLCRFHHVVREVMKLECDICGEPIARYDCDAIALVESYWECEPEDLAGDCFDCEERMSRDN